MGLHPSRPSHRNRVHHRHLIGPQTVDSALKLGKFKASKRTQIGVIDTGGLQRIIQRNKRSQTKELRDLSEQIISKWSQMTYEDAEG